MLAASEKESLHLIEFFLFRVSTLLDDFQLLAQLHVVDAFIIDDLVHFPVSRPTQFGIDARLSTVFTPQGAEFRSRVELLFQLDRRQTYPAQA